MNFGNEKIPSTMRFTDEEVALREAATVVLLRDGTEGLEVFMLRRNLNSDFVGGAYVFPGGGVDADDRTAALDAVCSGRGDADASRCVGLERGGLALWVAAIRESFEEAGLLLAYDDAGSVVDLDSDPARWIEHRRLVDSGERRLLEVCETERVRLAVDQMHFFARWITPEGPTRRYDTYFFLAAAPPYQTPLHDDRETIANEWLRPADGLHRMLDGELMMLPPTIAALEALTRFDTVDDAIDTATRIGEVPAILPRFIRGETVSHFLLPGQPGYDGTPIPDDFDPSTAPVPVTGFGLLPGA